MILNTNLYSLGDLSVIKMICNYLLSKKLKLTKNNYYDRYNKTKNDDFLNVYLIANRYEIDEKFLDVLFRICDSKFCPRTKLNLNKTSLSDTKKLEFI